MTVFEICAVLITLAAVFSYFNYRYVRLPTTIGIMLIALFTSVGVVVLGMLGLHVEQPVGELLRAIDFNEAVLQGMLAFLLFAGSIHVNLGDLAKQKWVIGWLATFGVISSTFVIGGFTYFLLAAFGIEMRFLHCLLFGALISPTDPIAVLGILKSAHVPKSLETKISGESLFNDGVGVVVFLTLLELSRGGGDLSLGQVSTLFVMETGGGILFGLAIGWIAYRMLKSVDNYQVEVLITLALAAGGYALAGRLHLSGPIAIVVAGLLIGNHGRMFAMSERTISHLDTFWELVDEILNAVLFLLIGMEVLVLSIGTQIIWVTICAIPLVLVARWVSVGIPILVFRYFRSFSKGVIRILTWGGLRGGISVALALSLPPGEIRQTFLPITYGIVIFSIAIQGLTIRRLVKSMT